MAKFAYDGNTPRFVARLDLRSSRNRGERHIPAPILGHVPPTALRRWSPSSSALRQGHGASGPPAQVDGPADVGGRRRCGIPLQPRRQPRSGPRHMAGGRLRPSARPRRTCLRPVRCHRCLHPVSPRVRLLMGNVDCRSARTQGSSADGDCAEATSYPRLAVRLPRPLVLGRCLRTASAGPA